MTAGRAREPDPFEVLGQKELTSFLAGANLQSHPAGNIIFRGEDASIERLYILKRGRIGPYRLRPTEGK